MRSSCLFLAFALMLSLVPAARAQNAPAGGDAAPPPAALSLDEYNNVPEGLLAPPTGEVKPVVAATPVLPDELGQIPGVYEIPGGNANTGAADESALSMDQVVNDYNQGKYDIALKNLRPMAEAKQHDAEELLGIMYLNGQGVEKNAAQAFSFFSKAAEGNKPVAQHYLAVMYFTGQGVEEVDNVRALMWLDIAILHYPDGPEKDRAKQDRDSIYVKMTRVEKNRSLQMARDWLDKQGEAHLLDMQE